MVIFISFVFLVKNVKNYMWTMKRKKREFSLSNHRRSGEYLPFV